MATLLRGAPVTAAITQGVAGRAAALEARGITPRLAIIRVGERPDDLAYERGVLSRAGKTGVAVDRIVLPESCSQAELLDKVRAASANEGIHGILLFRPLPAQLSEEEAAAAIAPEKDVDCLTDASLAHVLTGAGTGFAPCTAEAVVRLLDHYEVPLAGADVTVVGRSLVIGRPVSLMLQRKNATVCMCHTKTRDLAAHTRAADVVVVACGHARAIGPEHLAAGQVVVDVGINWDEAADKLVGDVDFDAACELVGAITPVPGGVGSITTAVLMDHVVASAERAAAREG